MNLNTFKGATLYNASPSILYEYILKNNTSELTQNGAVNVFSGTKMGRSPLDKRIVDNGEEDIWRSEEGPNFPMNSDTFLMNRETAINYLEIQETLFIFDGFAGWDKRYRIKIRLICSEAYHALFANNLLIRPSDEDLSKFGEPDFTIYNAGRSYSNKIINGSKTAVNIDFKKREMVILGTMYAGEIKKGIFSIMHYLMPKRNVLSLHSSVNQSKDGESTTIFFGLSGTGKTTLSADPNRLLIGDDEHCWHQDGIFNIEGGCYAKCIYLSEKKEPDIYNAIRFGTILENCIIDKKTRKADFNNNSMTENTRAAYPIHFIENAKIPCMTDKHPTNIILLTCDAFGVLPPISKLNTEQLMYHFISGYTSKIAGTEDGITEPMATFSACYGEAFIIHHPKVYATLLAEKVEKCGVNAWLVNTGWQGGKYGIGKRMSLKYTRIMIDAINNNTINENENEFETMDVFDLKIPNHIDGLPKDILKPWKSWNSSNEYYQELNKLKKLFEMNYIKYEDE
jgi:phosphoenolpyruvate carboxykinase (ATP)